MICHQNKTWDPRNTEYNSGQREREFQQEWGRDKSYAGGLGTQKIEMMTEPDGSRRDISRKKMRVNC